MTPEETSKAWDSWIASEQGEKCLGPGAVGEYLRNRLWWAYMAGAEAQGFNERALLKALERIASNDGSGDVHPSPCDRLRTIASNALRTYRGESY